MFYAFCDFDGVTEQLCKVIRQRLKKCLECRSKWAKLNCQQAEIAKKSYENIDDGSVTSYMEKNPDSINLEQQRKEEKGEGTTSKGSTSTVVSPGVKPPCHK